MILALALAAGSGWVVAALFVGLYLGERGRRVDAHRVARTHGVPLGDVRPAAVVDTGGPSLAEAAIPARAAEEMREVRDRYVQDAVDEGFDAKDAELDFDKMMASLATA